MSPKPVKNADDYIARASASVRPILQQVRSTIRKAVPQAVECFGYGMPGFKLNGKAMLYFAAFRNHYSLFAASGSFFEELKDELAGYETRKGTVHFPLSEPVPTALIARIAKIRAAGILHANPSSKLVH